MQTFLHVQRYRLILCNSTLQIPGRFEVPVQMDSDIVMPCDSSQHHWNWDTVQGKKQPNASEQMMTNSHASKEYQENSPVDTLDGLSFRTLSTSTAPESLSARSMESDNMKIASRQSSATDLGPKLHLRLKSCDAVPENLDCVSDRSYGSDVSTMLEECFTDIREFDTSICSKLSGILLRRRSLMRAESFDWPNAPHKEENNMNGFSQQYMGNVLEETNTRPLQKAKSLDKPPLDLSNMIAQFKMSSSHASAPADDTVIGIGNTRTEIRGIRAISAEHSERRHQDREAVDSVIMIPR